MSFWTRCPEPREEDYDSLEEYEDALDSWEDAEADALEESRERYYERKGY